MNGDDASRLDVPGYRLVRWLGAGGAATVYAATHPPQDERIAVKLFEPVDVEGGARLEQLLRADAGLLHAHIVGIAEIGRTHDGRLFHSMPLLHGLESRHGLRARPLRIAALLRELLAGLTHAHQQGVVHGGIKPANVLFDAHGRAQLADFGIAQWAAGLGRPNQDAASYLSPEQARGDAPGPASDLYSIGVLAFELLTGSLPFQGRDAIATAIAHIEHPVPRLPPRARAWQEWIDRALAKSPAQRFQSTEEMSDALGEIDGRHRHSALVGTKWHLPKWAIPAAAVLAVAVALAGWAAWAHRRATAVPATTAAPAPVEKPAPVSAVPQPPATLPAAAASVSPLAQHVQALIADADALRAQGRLFSPGRDDAAHQYLAALALDPRNPAAIAGIDALLATLRYRLDKAWQDGHTAATIDVLKQGDELVTHAGGSARRAWSSDRSQLAQAVGNTVVQAARAHDAAQIAALAPLASALPASYPAGLDLAKAERLASTPFAGERIRDPHGPLLVYVPAAGKLSAFAVAQVEVTLADYTKFAHATHRAASKCLEAHNPFSWMRQRSWQSPGFAQSGDHPVVCVSWNDAVAYAAWLSKATGEAYRLPSNGEWLEAAQGMPKGNPCQLGNVDDVSRKSAMDNDRWNCDDGAAETAAVGHYAPSGVGAYDMYGNVSEWLAGGTRGARDFRGLSWRDGSRETPLGSHGTAASAVGYTSVGFRVVRVIDDAHLPPRAPPNY